MNRKISFKELMEGVSVRSSENLSFTETFSRQLVSTIETGLRESGEVSIPGVGKFELRWMNERKGVHPQTGGEITIPGQNRIIFKPFKALREEINLPYAHLETRLISQDGTTTVPLSEARTFTGPEAESDTDSISPGRTTAVPETEMQNLTDSETEVQTGDPDPFGLQTDAERLWQGEVIIHPGPPLPKPSETPFFVELDEDSVSDKEELIIIRPSPVKSRQPKSQNPVGPMEEPVGDSGGRVSSGHRKTAQKLYWTILSIAVLLTLLIWMIFQISPGQYGSVEGETTPQKPSADNSVITREEPTAIPQQEIKIMPILVEEGETLWSIAGERLDNSYLWPWIYQMNRSSIRHPDLIHAGSRLDLPALGDRDLQRNELRTVAKSYFRLYRWHKKRSYEEARHYLWAAGSFDPNLLNEVEQQVDDGDLQFARNR